MTHREYREERRERRREFRNRARRINERTPLGLILLVVGGALLARQMGVLFPAWMFTWPVLLIVVGFFIGIANRFRDLGWLIMMGVGGFFLMDRVYPGMGQYAWPAVIIFLGLVIILRPRFKKKTPLPEPQAQPAEATGDDVLDAVAVFGAVKKIVLSKNFRGGEVVSVFGGSEINLSQADFVSPIRLEIVAIFGGAKLIVPSNWEVRSEATVILGGIDDKRDPATGQNPDKVIILEGTAICGGIEISSY